MKIQICPKPKLGGYKFSLELSELEMERLMAALHYWEEEPTISALYEGIQDEVGISYCWPDDEGYEQARKHIMGEE